MAPNGYSPLVRRSAVHAVPCPYVGCAPPTAARRSWAAALMSSICRFPRPDGPAIIPTSVGHFHSILRSQNVNSGLWLPPRISFLQEVILGVRQSGRGGFFVPLSQMLRMMQWIDSELKKIFTATNWWKYFIKKMQENYWPITLPGLDLPFLRLSGGKYTNVSLKINSKLKLLLVKQRLKIITVTNWTAVICNLHFVHHSFRFKVKPAFCLNSRGKASRWRLAVKSRTIEKYPALRNIVTGTR